MSCRHRLPGVKLALLMLLFPALVLAQTTQESEASSVAVAGICGPLENAVGPYDYRTATPAQRHIVENYHFTPPVEALRHGATGAIGADLDYTLRAFPNHARALYALSRYAQRLKTTRLTGAHYPAECYFERAVRFRPDDAQVRALYADFLIAFKRPNDAKLQLEEAERLDPPSPQIIYNLGLAWANLGNYEKALAYAKRAYAAGVQFPGLRAKLKAVGAWRD